MKTISFSFLILAALLITACKPTYRDYNIGSMIPGGPNSSLNAPPVPTADPAVPNLPTNQPATSTIDTNNKAAVIEAMNSIYNAPQPAMNFTGDVATCKAGTTSIEYQQAVINRINFFRAMIGVPAVTLNTDNSSYQNAALMMSANGQLSHQPPSTWKCYSAEGSQGASSSNLAIGVDGANAIDVYMDDWGSNNYMVGHRRWIISPMQSSIATGDVPGANSLGVNFGGAAPFPQGRRFTSWPSAGYFPTQLLPRSQRWSLSTYGLGLGQAEVAMKNITTGEIYTVTKEKYVSGYGNDTLVWVPQQVVNPAQGENIILVTISNLMNYQQSVESISYTVTVFNM